MDVWEKRAPVEKAAKTKAQRWDWAWNVPKTARKLVRPEYSEQENGEMSGWKGCGKITQALEGAERIYFIPRAMRCHWKVLIILPAPCF